MVDKMDPQITLTTSDDPPVSLTVSRSALVTHSKVFADMLSLDLESEDGSKSIPLSETEYEIKDLLAIIDPGEAPEADDLFNLDDNMWINLLQAADKYDCWHVMQAAEANIWRNNERYPRALDYFTFAIMTGNEDLISHTAKRAVLMRDLKCPSLLAAHEWRERLAVWRTLRATRIPQLIDRYRASAPGHSCDGGDIYKPIAENCFDSRAKGWDHLCRAAYEEYNLLRDPPLPLCEFIPTMGCRKWMIAIQKHAVDFERESSNWGVFPIKSIDFELKKESLKRLMGDGLIWKC